jgi:hypothetical protein
MPKIEYPSPPKVQDAEKFNEYMRRLHILIQGSGSVSSGSQDSDNVNFAEAEDRANHTGTQDSSTISDFDESVDDRVAVLTVGGNAITITYNDAAGTLTFDVDQALDAGAITLVTTETADNVYSANEKDMLNNLKADSQSTRTVVNDMRINLRASGIIA